MEERRIGVATQDTDEARRAEAERRPPERPIEREGVERFRAREDRDVSAGPPSAAAGMCRISVTVPSSTYGRIASCCALLKR